MASGAYFSYYNLADTATLSAYSGQTYVGTLPLTNLQDHRLSKKARTIDTLHGFSVGVDFGAPRFMMVAGLLGMNFINTGIPGTAATNNGVAALFNFSNVSIGASDVGQLNISYQDNTPAGTPASMAFPVNGNTGFTARYVSLASSWTLNSGVTFYEAGRLWLGDAIVLPGSVDEGWAQTIKDATTIQRSRGGQIYADIRQRYRQTRLDVSLVPRTQTYGLQTVGGGSAQNFQEMFLNAGQGQEVLALTRTDLGTLSSAANQGFVGRTGIYGVLAGEPTIIHQPGDVFRISMELAESL